MCAQLDSAVGDMKLSSDATKPDGFEGPGTRKRSVPPHEGSSDHLDKSVHQPEKLRRLHNSGRSLTASCATSSTCVRSSTPNCKAELLRLASCHQEESSLDPAQCRGSADSGQCSRGCVSSSANTLSLLEDPIHNVLADCSYEGLNTAVSPAARPSGHGGFAQEEDSTRADEEDDTSDDDDNDEHMDAGGCDCVVHPDDEQRKGGVCIHVERGKMSGLLARLMAWVPQGNPGGWSAVVEHFQSMHGLDMLFQCTSSYKLEEKLERTLLVRECTFPYRPSALRLKVQAAMTVLAEFKKIAEFVDAAHASAHMLPNTVAGGSDDTDLTADGSDSDATCDTCL